MKITDILKDVPSMWDEIKENKIVLYGMGDGAVKLLKILDRMGLKCSGIFASDDFVRHQTFMGFTVKSLAELEDELGEFTVLTAFATRLTDVMDNFKRIAERHRLFVPDINVSGDYLEVFDREFLGRFGDRIDRAYDALDPYGKAFFEALLSYKLSGELSHLDRLESLRQIEEEPFDYHGVQSFADFGAYTGDTVREALFIYPRLGRAVAFEPDPKSFKKLEANTSNLGIEVTPINALVWNDNTMLTLRSGGAMNTIIEQNVSESEGLQKKKFVEVKAVTGDSALPFLPDVIKMDVEGCEIEAIEGCEGIIREHSPHLRVSIYHNHRDIFSIYEKISAINSGYSYTLRQKCRYIPAWDVEIIAFKKF